MNQILPGFFKIGFVIERFIRRDALRHVSGRIMDILLVVASALFFLVSFVLSQSAIKTVAWLFARFAKKTA